MSLLLVGIALLVVFIAYCKWQHSYWKRRGIPGPEGVIFLGNFWELTDNKRPAAMVIRDWTKKFGKVFGYQEGVRKTLVISEPDTLQELFVKKFDNFYGRKNHLLAADTDNDARVHVFEAQGIRWKRLRTITAPTFAINSLKKIHATVEDSAIELTKLLETRLDQPIDIHKFFQEYTMDVISRLAMGQKESNFFNNPTVQLANGIFGRSFRNPVFILSAVAPFLQYQLRKFFLAIAPLRKSTALTIHGGIYAAVDRRIAQRAEDEKNGIEPGEPEDFIDLFLDARDESVVEDNSEYSRANTKISRSLTREEIVAQCFVFILAGFDTTANALSSTCWLVSKSPAVLKKLQEEIDSVWGYDENISFEKVNKLKYMENVMKETLRLYPLAAFAESRTCLKKTTLGGVEVEEGICVMADVWSVQRDKTLWGPDAEEFKPERWESSDTRHALAWLPFGAGPRVCIGQRLAVMEERLALAHILRRFDIVSGPKTESELKLFGSTTISPESTTVYLKRR